MLAGSLAAGAIKCMPHGVILIDSGMKVLSANGAFSDISGFTIDEITDKPVDFLSGELTENSTLEKIRSAINSGDKFLGELLCYSKSGSTFWTELSITPVHDDQGGVTRFIGIVRDISESKAVESALQTSEKFYRTLIHHIPAGIVIHGAGSEILHANEAASEILGLSIDQMAGKVAIDPAWHFQSEDGSIMLVEDYPVNRVLASGASILDIVLGVHRPSRSDIAWLICNAFPVFDRHGALSQVIVCFTNVSPLKQAELALQKSEERLRLVLLGTKEAPWDWELATNTMYYSPRWWKMLGRDVNEAVIDPEYSFSLLHPDDRQRAQDDLTNLMMDKSVQTFESEFRLQSLSGEYLPVLCRGFISRNKNGDPLRISGTNTDLTERKKAEAQIYHLAYFDALTSLPNRSLLFEQLRMSLSKRSRQTMALLFIDLDNFKALNDTLGHAVGDELLKLVAARLLGSVRKSDHVARLGGDEFVIILEDLGEDRQLAAVEADQIARHILAALNEPYLLMNKPFRSSPSIGVTLFGETNSSIEELLKQADVAMYQAKEAGRNRICFFEARMQVAVDKRVSMENDLRSALQHEQFCLHCQPQVNMNGHLIGGEALVRWQHPERGLILPNRFISLAEATGLILPLGEWVLRTACEHLVLWAEDDYLKNIPLSVNISPHQFRESDFVDQVLKIVHETGARPQRLKLELTEGLMAENVNDMIEKMTALNNVGISFSLDDFGTGYSSLSYLKRFPLTELKIDQSFIHDVMIDAKDAAITRIIVTLADQLGLQAIAEGVETQEQFQFLLNNQCTAIQGFFFGKPVPIETFKHRFEALQLQ